MTTSWELIMAAHTSWHSSEAASGEKQSKEKNGASRFLFLTYEQTNASQRLVCDKKAPALPRLKAIYSSCIFFVNSLLRLRFFAVQRLQLR